MDLVAIEQELKKRLAYPYVWGRKQNDRYDRLTRFIYRTRTFEQLIFHLERIKTNPAYNRHAEDIRNYALNRWYNYWSARAVEEIFCTMHTVEPERDTRNRFADFSINGIRFDHKTTIYPKGFNKPLKQAQAGPKELIKWLYLNQSRERRKHFANRLFIVLHSFDGEHWKLKAEIEWLGKKIETYVKEFHPTQLHRCEFEAHPNVWADIIWAIKYQENGA